MHLVKTDLPAPLSPHRAVILPAGRARSTPYSACTAPKCLSTPRTLRRGSATCAIFVILLPRKKMPPRTPRGGIRRFRLGDSVVRADLLRDGLAESALVDEIVFDDRRGDLRLVDPQRSQEDGGLGVAGLARGRGGRSVDERGRRLGAGAKDGGQRDCRLSLQVDGLVDGAGLVALEDVLDALQGGVLAHGRDLVGAAPFLFRTVNTALARPAFASIRALRLLLAVYFCWQIV